MSNSQQKAPLHRERRFYTIEERDDGTVDVFLNPTAYMATTPEGFRDYDITITVVHNVDPNDPRWGGDLEGHIRANYTAWCESGEVIYL